MTQGTCSCEAYLYGSGLRRHLRPIHSLLIPLGAQYGATLSNPVQKKPLTNAGFANPCNLLQHLTDHS
jgi:hypothetical protein